MTLSPLPNIKKIPSLSFFVALFVLGASGFTASAETNNLSPEKTSNSAQPPETVASHIGSSSAIPDSSVPELKITPVTINPASTLEIMQKVADWQLANPATNKTTVWIQGAGYIGFMALAGISPDSKYRNAMMAMGETNQWQLGARPYHADDHCVGQTYAELYMLNCESNMIAPLRERFDFILSCLLYTSPSPRDRTRSRMPSSA